MNRKFRSAWGCRIGVAAVMVLLAGLCAGAPWLVDWAVESRYLRPEAARAILWAFYPCAVAAEAAMVLMMGLLNNILRGQVFVEENVRRIKGVAVCCALVALICLPAAACYLGLLFLSLIMGFLCLVVCVVGSLMSAAVALREENDLTI